MPAARGALWEARASGPRLEAGRAEGGACPSPLRWAGLRERGRSLQRGLGGLGVILGVFRSRRGCGTSLAVCVLLRGLQAVAGPPGSRLPAQVGDAGAAACVTVPGPPEVSQQWNSRCPSGKLPETPAGLHRSPPDSSALGLLRSGEEGGGVMELTASVC